MTHTNIKVNDSLKLFMNSLYKNHEWLYGPDKKYLSEPFDEYDKIYIKEINCIKYGFVK